MHVHASTHDRLSHYNEGNSFLPVLMDLDTPPGSNVTTGADRNGRHPGQGLRTDLQSAFHPNDFYPQCAESTSTTLTNAMSALSHSPRLGSFANTFGSIRYETAVST